MHSKIYRDCLRVALYLGNKQGNTATIKEHIKREFKKNMFESDPTKVEQMRKRY